MYRFGYLHGVETYSAPPDVMYEPRQVMIRAADLIRGGQERVERTQRRVHESLLLVQLCREFVTQLQRKAPRKNTRL
jgi:hypothetical protein